jgi:uncharacterized repeat protein (TIGR01451 family)
MRTDKTTAPNSLSYRLGIVIILGAITSALLFTGTSASSFHSFSGSGSRVSKSALKAGAAADKQGTNTYMHRLFGGLLADRNVSSLGRASALDETIQTFAADCSTSKSSFYPGETVCAKTDGVDLQGSRFVNWIDPGLVVVYGGSGTTDITTNPQTFLYTLPFNSTVGTWKVSIAVQNDISQTPAVFTVNSPPPIVTYAAGCVMAQSTFDLGNDVCARATGGLVAPRRIAWIDPAGFIRQVIPITTDPQNDTFTLPTTSTSVLASGITVKNIGTWRVNILSNRGSLVATTSFAVSDPADATADLSIRKTISPFSEQVPAGSSSTFEISVANNGPDTALSVVLTDVVPANTTFVAFNQLSGPIFSCPTNPSPGGTGTVTCSVSSLPAGSSASFDFAFTVNEGTAAGTLIPNTATIFSNSTTELDPNDNSATAVANVSGGGGAACTLDCPNNIVVTATSPSGAIVTYPAPDTFGSCGTVNMSKASNTLFPVGTTTVTAQSSEGGGLCSFTVTVINLPAPTIACPANITVTAPSGASQAFVPNTGGTSSNPGSPAATGTNVVVTGERSDGEGLTAAYPVGVTAIIWTAKECTDPGSNPPCQNPFVRSVSCTQLITVIDATPLTVTCPTNKTFNAPTGTCAFTATAAQIGTATKTPASATLTSARSDGQPLLAAFPAGTTAITWTATALDGRTTSCTQIITVNANDTTAPVLTVPPNLNVTTDTCVALLDDELGVATATDNCSSSVSITRTGVPPGFAFPVGTTIITYVATDASGNATQGTQQVTVVANNPGLQCFPGPIKVWLGIKNSDDVGTKFDLLAEVFKNDIPIGSGQLNDVSGGSSGFSNAVLRTINVALSGNQGGFLTGDKLSIRLSVRIAASSSHVNGTARLWFNDSAANSRLTATVGQTTGDYFLRKDINHNPVLFLDAATGSPPSLTIDVLVNRNLNGNPFLAFGTWIKTF